jgi:TetR/AcrR family transcriptional repressor of nem operon
MRYPAGHKQKTSDKILDTAGRLFRQHGYEGTGVDKVMAAAGLTAGGFYSHFSSKQDLLAGALDHVFCAAQKDRPAQLSKLAGHEWLQGFVSFYLSKQHRDSPARGCPIASLAGEVSRIGGKPRTVFRQHAQRVIDSIARQFDGERPDRQRAIITMAQCLGGLLLARAVGKSELSEEILATCKESVMDEIARLEM